MSMSTQHQQLTSAHGRWQSSRDMNKRKEMIQHIIVMLQKDSACKVGVQEWLVQLPQMVQQLEAALYRSAPSLEAYLDQSTLKHRLKVLAIEIAKNTCPLDIENVRMTSAVGASTLDTASRIKNKQQRLLLLHHASQCPHGDGNCPRFKQCVDYKRLWHHISHCAEGRCGVSHCLSSRAILSHYRSCKNTGCEICRPIRQKILSGEKDC